MSTNQPTTKKMSTEKQSPIEGIKIKSDGLRGTLKESIELDNHTGNVRADDEALVKFHGMYVQDDRDRREERAEKKVRQIVFFYDSFTYSGWNY